ncbi:MAG: tripartite tricarboxylate transporter permease [Deltaproteobacteria bacterium]|nr:MAG: tripartite tricarboxylate transporter permease [Deltaproteobacteria bacterium]
MEIYLDAILTIFEWQNLISIVTGVTIGIIIGAIPGLGAVTAIAAMLPITFKLDPVTGIMLLLGVFCGATYGGSISATLIHTPGTPSAAATLFDAYPMAQKGVAGRALGFGVISSGIGGLFSAFVLLFLGPAVAKWALKFGPPELLAVCLFGLTMVASISGASLLKGLMAATLGLLFASIGQDPLTGVERFTLGNVDLLMGIGLVTILVGIYAGSEILRLTELLKKEEGLGVTKKLSIELPSFKELRNQMRNFIWSAGIGTIVGIIPGVGAAIASFISYGEAKRRSKHPEDFGTGIPDGIVASETANNAVTGGALVPLLTLGIPGCPVAAILLGALIIQGLYPGPKLFVEHQHVAYSLFVGLIVANIFMVGLGIMGIRFFSKVIIVPKAILIPIIVIFCTVSIYSIYSSIFQIWLFFFFVMFGYLFQKFGFPLAPIALGFVLGSLTEKSFRQTLIMFGGSFTFIHERPLVSVLLIITFLSLLRPLFLKWRKRNK